MHGWLCGHNSFTAEDDIDKAPFLSNIYTLTVWQFWVYSKRQHPPLTGDTADEDSLQPWILEAGIEETSKLSAKQLNDLFQWTKKIFEEFCLTRMGTQPHTFW
jgi:hypothetical protein